MCVGKSLVGGACLPQHSYGHWAGVCPTLYQLAERAQFPSLSNLLQPECIHPALQGESNRDRADMGLQQLTERPGGASAQGHLHLHRARLPEKVQSHGACIHLGLQQLAQAQQGVPAHPQHQRSRARLQHPVAAAHQDERALQMPSLPAGLRHDLQLHPAPWKPGSGHPALCTSPFGGATTLLLSAIVWQQLGRPSGIPYIRHACHATTPSGTGPLPFSHFQLRTSFDWELTGSSHQCRMGTPDSLQIERIVMRSCKIRCNLELCRGWCLCPPNLLNTQLVSCCDE